MLDIREKELFSGPTASFQVRKELTQGDTVNFARTTWI